MNKCLAILRIASTTRATLCKNYIYENEIVTGPWRSWRGNRSGCESSLAWQGSCWTEIVTVQRSKWAADARTIAVLIHTGRHIAHAQLIITYQFQRAVRCGLVV